MELCAIKHSYEQRYELLRVYNIDVNNCKYLRNMKT